MMKKIYGAEGRHDGVYRVGREKYEAIIGLGEDEMGKFNYREKFRHRPTVEEVKANYQEAVNEDVRESILRGLKFEGHLVWLDAASQRNYLAKAVQVQGGTDVLPIEVKLGTDEAPYFKTFETAEEYMVFFNLVTDHITKCQRDGWEVKEDVEWSDFEDVKEVCE